MNRKLHRVLDEIQKTERKIAEWQEHLKELKLLAEQLENQEIVKTIRSMKLDSRRMLEFLEGLQEGSVCLPVIDQEEIPVQNSGLDKLADNMKQAQETVPERGGNENEEI